MTPPLCSRPGPDGTPCGHPESAYMHDGRDWGRKLRTGVIGHEFAPPVPETSAAPTRYEYRTTSGPRKSWDGEPDLTKEGWEPISGADSWERFDYHEERYWRRAIPAPPASLPVSEPRASAHTGPSLLNQLRAIAKNPDATWYMTSGQARALLKEIVTTVEAERTRTPRH